MNTKSTARPHAHAAPAHGYTMLLLTQAAARLARTQAMLAAKK